MIYLLELHCVNSDSKSALHKWWHLVRELAFMQPVWNGHSSYHAPRLRWSNNLMNILCDWYEMVVLSCYLGISTYPLPHPTLSPTPTHPFHPHPDKKVLYETLPHHFHHRWGLQAGTKVTFNLHSPFRCSLLWAFQPCYTPSMSALVIQNLHIRE